MGRRTNSATLDRVVAIVGSIFEVEPERVVVSILDAADAALLHVGRHRLAIAIRASGSTADVESGAGRVRALAARTDRRAIPVVVVPRMGHAAQSAAARASIGVVDLAGNARIRAGSVFVHVEGRVDASPRPGRPADAFAPRARRIAATLIEHPSRTFSQRELAHAASLDEGRTSRIVRQLEADGYLERGDGGVRLTRRERLIDAYRDARPFSKEAVLQGAIVSRSGDAAVRTLRDLFVDEAIAFAATGPLAAHAYLDRSVPRRVTFYVERIPGRGASTLAGLSFGDSTPNVDLVVPRDARVFEASRTIRGLRCAPPLDVYADLASFMDVDPRLSADLRATL